MKLCKRCNSTDVAKAVWMHLNTIGVADMEQVDLYWCFNCKDTTDIVDKCKEISTIEVTTQVNRTPTEIKVTSVQAHFREQPIFNEPKQLEFHTNEWKRGQMRVRCWMLVKNAKKWKDQNDVEWESEKDGKVRVWHTLKETNCKRKKK